MKKQMERNKKIVVMKILLQIQKIIKPFRQ